MQRLVPSSVARLVPVLCVLLRQQLCVGAVRPTGEPDADGLLESLQHSLAQDGELQQSLRKASDSAADVQSAVDSWSGTVADVIQKAKPIADAVGQTNTMLTEGHEQVVAVLHESAKDDSSMQQ
eukprot:gnl/TRDRNA2_/TRDRNA2_181606_c0_seq1.p1 gnl/TRDRNA2_/TRDRNA2_181606_c0~~gnl/TRDRNA2_/TRDRNA2_181606_c0_seq1.p1  ORF type:complete len:124 (+),score=31.60 gnl/TRDRNA2_/TRDRNA2_181606_c0_seq1:71-442(+)